MDDLTRERYGPPPQRRPYAEPDVITERRLILCGTDDLKVLGEAQQHVRLAAARRARDARLVSAIRRAGAA